MEVFSRGTGVEVRFPTGWYDEAPRCEHGPMLLFEKFVKGKPQQRRYYSCSACRDRKFCNAFVYEDDFNKKSWKQSGINASSSKSKKPMLQSQYRLCDLLGVDFSEILFCETCQRVWLKKDVSSSMFICKNHKIKNKVSHDDVLHASRKLLYPLENDKKNAQYFLTKRSSMFLQTTLQRLKFTKIICIGMPTLHEEIQTRSKCSKILDGTQKPSEMTSILLDIDQRFFQFTDPGEFCHFNMFNHHFFEESQAAFHNFISSAKSQKMKIAVVLDPPFGGLVDAIAETLQWLSQTIFDSANAADAMENNFLSVFWIFPYFLEKKVTSACPNLKMLDYQVNYENHAKFKATKRSSRISPVRIFTNVELNKIVLPANEGYRLCTDCQRYVAPRNIHCQKCGMCPSKDGRTYVHCDKCGKCVKPGRRHCDICGRCETIHHECRTPDEIVLGCHICGKLTHKRRDCPLSKTEKRHCQDRATNGNNGDSSPMLSATNNVIFHKKCSHSKRRKYSIS